MAFIDILNKAADISEASLIKYFQQYRKRDNALHIFLEGVEDQAFYSNYIEQIYGVGITRYYYISNGKDNVYQNYWDIRWGTYAKSRTLFFVDKDLDDILGIRRPEDENIFVTKYYSVENYIVTPIIYEKLLREFCYLNESEILSELKNKFQEQNAVFFQTMKTIIAWIVYCRKNSLQLNLNDITLSNLLAVDSNFDITRISQASGRSGFKYICEATKTSHFHLNDIRKIINEIDKVQDSKVILRGKYELWFLYAFYEKTIKIVIPKVNEKIKEHNRVSRRKKNKCKIMVTVTLENIFLLAASKLQIPQDLHDFLQTNKLKYNAIA